MSARTVQVRRLSPGDVVVDALGRPYYRVLANCPAMARGYRVLMVEPLSRVAEMDHPSRQTSAHGEDLRDVQRVEGT